MTGEIDADYVRRVVEAMEEGVATGWVSWAISNHDFARVISRWGFQDLPDQAAPTLFALVASLRGSPCLYQGEELGLSEAEIAREDIRDPYGLAFWPDFKGRDGCRTPYPWRHDEAQGGFSQAPPWLPVPQAHLSRAYDLQILDPQSALSRIRRFLHWRRDQAALIRGDIRFLDSPKGLLTFMRALRAETIACAFNLSRQPIGWTPPKGARLLDQSGFTAPQTGEGWTIPPLGALFMSVLSDA